MNNANTPAPPAASAPGQSNQFISGHAALISLLCYAGLVLYALSYSWTAPDNVWVRVIYLLTGVEAIAFAAAGFLFGREVHRGAAEASKERAQEAETRADTAEERARTLAVEAEKGKTLAGFVLAPNPAHALAGKGGGELEMAQRLAAQLYSKSE